MKLRTLRIKDRTYGHANVYYGDRCIGYVWFYRGKWRQPYANKISDGWASPITAAYELWIGTYALSDNT